MNYPAVVVAIMVFVVAIGPVLYPVDPLRTEPSLQLQPPGIQHVFGTDLFGRDMLSRTLHGGRYTLLMSACSTLLALLLGIPLGACAITRQDAIRVAAQVIINALLALPGLLIALVILTLLGRGFGPLIVGLGLAQIASVGYTTRAALTNVMAEPYVEAAKNLGATPFHIFRHYLLPNALPTIAAYAGVVFSYMILNGAALTFLGLGIEPGIPEWGGLLAEGRATFRTAPWIGFAPGIGITLIVWSVNALADQLR
jgi:ABC-type dipeptide/oligopeptide/nickel transport system permease subunit